MVEVDGKQLDSVVGLRHEMIRKQKNCTDINYGKYGVNIGYIFFDNNYSPNGHLCLTTALTYNQRQYRVFVIHFLPTKETSQEISQKSHFFPTGSSIYFYLIKYIALMLYPIISNYPSDICRMISAFTNKIKELFMAIYTSYCTSSLFFVSYSKVKHQGF